MVDRLRSKGEFVGRIDAPDENAARKAIRSSSGSSRGKRKAAVGSPRGLNHLIAKENVPHLAGGIVWASGAPIPRKRPEALLTDSALQPALNSETKGRSFRGNCHTRFIAGLGCAQRA
jgi:hypothetical protein